MWTKRQIRELVEARGRGGFVTTLHHWLGLTNAKGHPHTDLYGNHRRVAPKVNPREINPAVLLEAIMGEEWTENFRQGGALSQSSVTGSARYLRALEERHGLLGSDGTVPLRRELLEANPGVDVTAFLNINTFSIAVGGLVEAAILEAYETPNFAIRPLFTTQPTRKNGEKIIGTTTLGPQGSKGPAEERKPGMVHRRVGFGERWVETPETHEMALAVEVNRETMFFDLTGQVMDRAQSVGFQLAYREEMDCVDVFAGLVNSYNYGGTGYNTYQATNPWINDLVNPFADQASIEKALLLLSQMTDQEHGQLIAARSYADTIVTVPVLERRILNILGARSIETRTNANQPTVNIAYDAQNIYAGQFKVVVSDHLWQRLRAPDGGNLSAANAEQWWVGNPGKSFVFMQNWPLETHRASPEEYELVDRGIIAAFFANYRGVPAVKEPRYEVRNRAS